MRWRRQTQFSAFGRQYELPLKKADLKDETTPEVNLEYLSGFFDGDGCVTPEPGLRSCSLRAAQVAINSEILMLFRESLGGAIHIQQDGHGFKRAQLRWVLSGDSGKEAAKALATASIVKHEQLLLAARWPHCRKAQIAMAREVKLLKDGRCRQQNVKCTWEYVAGFFDAEGCITVPPSSTSMQLCISQAFDGVLHPIRNLLQDVCFSELHITQSAPLLFKLNISSKNDVIRVLRRLLSAGLLQKKGQAKAVLGLDKCSHDSVRETLSMLKGNQMRYARMDSEGCERARAIACLGSRVRCLRSRGRLAEASAKQQQLDQLREEHAFLKLGTAYRMLRADIRTGLAEGAILAPFP